MPSHWWENHMRRSNGYFGCEITRDNDEATGFNMWTFFQTKEVNSDTDYKWSKFNIFTRWIAKTNKTAILLFEPNKSPNPFDKIALNADLLGDPFWVLTHVLDELCKLQDNAVWLIRDSIRMIEKEKTPQEGQTPNYRKLHDIARHSIHVIETLDVTLLTVEQIIEGHKTYVTPQSTSPQILTTPSKDHIWQDVHARLIASQGFLASQQQRAIANEKRLKNEIQLTFQMVARSEATVMIEDSAALKTIAIVTYTFLPPTFICALFSMSFFNYDRQLGWAMSPDFWIYWAIALPASALSVGLWYYWQKSPPSRTEQEKVDRFSRRMDRLQMHQV
ncbi:hypothetical protein N7539_008182 [Penicillium diatomitis]|uniref:Mg2+ transporter protein, CorA-like/Zinc transport protein ZntB n=1 Tax=Penicillium diatomitis TaxID=2819901 RepID=A0A9W9WT98_9EURO|nr:uncharacterized protein N7539_008182 [Penicillium diatomitis]KAJ5475116.1 hypothetical protein N7539_008182 [Penicillium diatomitis]